MTHALAFGACESFEPERAIARWLPWLQCWHRQYEHPIAVGRIGQYTVNSVWQGNITVVGSDRPLRDQDLWLLLARAAIFTAHGDPVAADNDGNILRLQPRHRRGKDEAIVSLMELYWNGLLYWNGHSGSPCDLCYVVSPQFEGNFCTSAFPDVAPRAWEACRSRVPGHVARRRSVPPYR